MDFDRKDRSLFDGVGVMLALEIKNGKLFCLKDGNPVGTIVNHTSGLLATNGCEDPSVFAAIFSGHGSIYHQSSNPPNPFFIKSWAELFENPDLLPQSSNIFIDPDCDSYFAVLDVPRTNLKVVDLESTAAPKLEKQKEIERCAKACPKDLAWGRSVLIQLKAICKQLGIKDITRAVHTARHQLTPYDVRREAYRGNTNRNNVFIDEMFDLFRFVPNQKFKQEVVRQCRLIFEIQKTTLSIDNHWKLHQMIEWEKQF
jgi:hypothetical protein